ncbi:peptidase S41 [Flavobacterium zepuense]|uniref:Peptidase S41 n=1 Tax=Flavobacterium zepuense TaxID=2593302 RepID=A0A552VAD9_9FLAO|nr:S41 family peptidase [Flavobacterium zepuense]TRW27443.1 peptidase S41 [Flavobacterium zepuense]
MKILAAFAFLFTLQVTAQNNEKACSVFNTIASVMQTRHYQPKPVDDSLSAYVYTTVMEQLDNNRTLFIKAEQDQLEKHKYKIDDYLKGNDCSFFTDFITTYKSALERNKKFVEEIAKEPLTYNTKDTIFYSKKNFPFHSNTDKVKNFIRKKITFDILEDISMLSKNKDSLKQHLDKLFPLSKTKVIETYLCRVNSLLSPNEGFDNSVYNKFFSVFCSYFDPHSTYFNYNEKASFVSSISTENYSLGLYVSQNNKEEIVVEEVVPGGPAYASKKVDKGDKIVKLAANDTEYIVSCASMQTINDIVSSDTYKDVDLTLRKQDGTLYTVSLKKQVMKADDHSVFSYILGDGNEKMGYIKIPSFYSPFDSGVGSGCADDVAKEVSKLKKSDVKGLIIDLQYNGGGSMDEVIRLAGMFINYGPVSIVTDKNQTYNTVRDYNRGMIFNGPMVVLVNGFTASASEFFAGVMQDYNRAVIVGSPTVGKATMQTITPLDEANQTDFVKVTIDKFYRVSGKSSQYVGILPDVELPYVFNDMLPREKTMPTAIKNDSIPINVRYSKMPADGLKKAVIVSKQRVGANPMLSNIISINKRVGELYKADKAPLPITFDAVYADTHSMDKLWKEITTELEKENKITITNAVGKSGTDDDFYKSVNEFKVKSIKTDPYIFEGLNILKDLNNYKSR